MSTKRFFMVLAVAFAGGIIGGILSGGITVNSVAHATGDSKGPQKIVEAEEFRLVDQHGYVWAKLTTREPVSFAPGVSGAFLEMYEAKREDTKDVIQPLLKDDNGAYVPEERASLSLSTYPYASVCTRNWKYGAHACMKSTNTSPSIRMGISDYYIILDGSINPSLMFAKGEKVTCSLEPNALSINDERGRGRALLGRAELKNVSDGSTTTTALGSLTLFNEDGNVVYRVP